MSTKQVIVIRKDLKMRRGKEIAQGAHASMAFLWEALKSGGPLAIKQAAWEWWEGNHRKVCLQVNSEAELLAVHAAAVEAEVESHLITDMGLTEFDGVPTKTCLALGPDYDARIDAITASLKLY